LTAYRKKLIEVALPLEAINAEAIYEKDLRGGHPSALHIWWARRPLAACRAVLFASLVDDPSALPEQFPTLELQEAERQRLFRIIEAMVKWENVNNEEVMEAARAEIMRSTGGNPPPVLDPFCGGGSIPLEAQRLGLEAHASDLNPVAVLITKALIEIPPKFANMPPVHPGDKMARSWKGAQGLAEDVRYYGKWMRDEAFKRIGHLYPKVQLPKEYGKDIEATVIAWLWARTVTCPNPACGASMPLVRSFALSSKKGKVTWVEPAIDPAKKCVQFTVRSGVSALPEPSKLGRGANFNCLVCGNIADETHIKAEGAAGRMSAQLMAIAAEGKGCRIYLPPNAKHEVIASQMQPEWKPDASMSDNPRWFSPPMFGMTSFADLYTVRQLVALTAFSDLVREAHAQVRRDAVAVGLPDDCAGLEEGGKGATAYADGVATYLGICVDKASDLNSSLCTWTVYRECPIHVFTRQSIVMSWDYTEANIFSQSSGSWDSVLINLFRSMSDSCLPAVGTEHTVDQGDCRETEGSEHGYLVSTDPPYYDNIGYADLSDYFYVWLRRSLHSVYPQLFKTMLVPKAQELVATPHRFGGSKAKADEFFEHGLRQTFVALRAAQNHQYPLTIYYAFKQAESTADTEQESVRRIGGSLASTGWETMLVGLLVAGFSINGTWPMRTERNVRSTGRGTNALASSIVLVCRPRPADAPTASRREFLQALKRELPEALRTLQHGNIAPVDLAQAAIGPGMAVYSRYAQVIEPDGSPLRVRAALVIINQCLDEVLAEQEGELDADTRWAIAWFAQYGMEEGPFGTAETLSRAMNTSVEGMVRAGVIRAAAGKVRLLRRDELPADWSPSTDSRLTVWETAQHLIHTLQNQGEFAAAALLTAAGSTAECARDLAYRLYTICERKGWASEALAYNSLVTAWSGLGDAATRAEAARGAPVQGTLAGL
jgi:putative DNA methylase